MAEVIDYDKGEDQHNQDHQNGKELMLIVKGPSLSLLDGIGKGHSERGRHTHTIDPLEGKYSPRCPLRPSRRITDEDERIAGAGEIGTTALPCKGIGPGMTVKEIRRRNRRQCPGIHLIPFAMPQEQRRHFVVINNLSHTSPP